MIKNYIFNNWNYFFSKTDSRISDATLFIYYLIKSYFNLSIITTDEIKEKFNLIIEKYKVLDNEVWTMNQKKIE